MRYCNPMLALWLIFGQLTYYPNVLTSFTNGPLEFECTAVIAILGLNSLYSVKLFTSKKVQSRIQRACMNEDNLDSNCKMLM